MIYLPNGHFFPKLDTVTFLLMAYREHNIGELSGDNNISNSLYDSILTRKILLNFEEDDFSERSSNY